MITIYLQLAPDVATMRDNIRKTPLHMLCSVPCPCFSNSTGGAIRAYTEQCVEGKMAAFMKDNEKMTPFDYLCEKSYDDMEFLKNKSFGGLMEWWHDCLGINLLACTFEVTELSNRKRKAM